MFRFFLCFKLLVICLSLSAQMSQQAYVWQRNWSPQLKTAIQTQSDELDGLTVLYGEYNIAYWGKRYLNSNLDFGFLKSTGVPVTLAFRMNWFPGYSVETSFNSGFYNWLGHALAKARNNGLEPAAVEIDFDCPTSKLELYAEQLRVLRQKLDGIPLSITTLPTWIERPEAFRQLVSATDHIVLQVHSMKRADHFDTQVSLCDPGDAMRWTKQAAAYGMPYRVALPTYSYRLAYDERDELVEADGLIRLELVQRSGIAARPPRQLLVKWKGATALAWDGQRNYTVKELSGDGLIWQWPDRMEPPFLAKGTRWTIGWLRLDSEAELEFTIYDYAD